MCHFSKRLTALSVGSARQAFEMKGQSWEERKGAVEYDKKRKEKKEKRKYKFC